MNAVSDLTNFRVVLSDITGSGVANRQLDLEYDIEEQALWAYMKPAGSPCFNPAMLGEIRATDLALEASRGNILFGEKHLPVAYHVAASRCKGVFNYGGDLAHFMVLIKTRNEAVLRAYATTCIDALYSRLRSYDSPATTISLVQGDALGGGLESALASHVIIAEEGTRMGFPEILFNLFPGMGAYSLVSRRVGRIKAEEIILSGKIYDASELHEMGLVDIVAPKGRGEEAVNEFIRKNRKRSNGMRAVFECRNAVDPVSYAELERIIDIWVDAAMRLEEKDLKMMGRLVRSQLANHASRAEESTASRPKRQASM
jgi:DSF synthase